MNPELDLLLSAYLDDELDPEPRLRVEAALHANPVAADRLAVLARVRDLVASLPAPEPCPDVSGEVVAVLASRRRASFRTVRYATAILSGLAAAAFLLMLRGPGAAPRDRPAVAESTDPPRPSPAPPAPPRLASVAPPPRPIPAMPSQDASIREDLLAAEVRDRDDRAALAGILGRGGVLVVDMQVDEIGPASLEAIDEIVQKTSRVRPDHAKVHVVQGVEIDPARPGKACAYVLVMDEHEYAKFRRKIDDRFPEAASAAVPLAQNIAASLSKVGHLEFFGDMPAAGTLTPPPADLQAEVAILANRHDAHDEVIIDPRGVRVRPRATARKPEAGRPKAAAPGGALAVKESPLLVYVLWVSPRDRSRG